MLELLSEYDVAILGYINSFCTTTTAPFWLFVTKIYVWIPLFIALYLYALKAYTKKQVFAFFLYGIILLALTVVVTECTKLLVMRVRPCNNSLLRSVLNTYVYPKSYSFYSGHAANSIALTLYTINIFGKKLKLVYVLIFWALLFMLSRLLLAVHYPSDIMVGIIMGFITYRILISLPYFRYKLLKPTYR